MLTWDAPGSRRYETGIDRGVLYLPEGGAVPWNGLSGITETLSREVKTFYTDGIKYLDSPVLSDYSAKLQAFTYPEELEALLGTAQYAQGIFVHDQRFQPFSMSYRTRVGNDLEGTDYAYKLHLIYNVLAMPSDTASSSLSETVSPVLFEWTLSGTPALMWGIRPTSHISLHSQLIDPDLLKIIEDTLYGTPDVEPRLPSVIDFLGQVEAFYAP